MSKETGGSAFPLPCSAAPSGGVHWAEEGMTLRDYFAAKAMQGLIEFTGVSYARVAAEAYEIADAMLEARR